MLILSIMKRRSFIKSVGALGLSSIAPLPTFGSASAFTSQHVAGETYKWAEKIVRAHNKCSIPMLQRLLGLDTATASAVKSSLMENGVISLQANSFGIHTASKPLFEGAFLKPANPVQTVSRKILDTIDSAAEIEQEIPEKESEINALNQTCDSVSQAENDASKATSEPIEQTITSPEKPS